MKNALLAGERNTPSSSGEYSPIPVKEDSKAAKNKMGFKTPQETMAVIMEGGIKKTEKSWDKICVLGFMAGAYIAFGAFLSIIVSQNVKPWPDGFARLLAGCMFPVGLMFVIVQGAELFTSSVFMVIPGLLEGRVTWSGIAKNWGLCYVSNFVGSIFTAYFLGYLTELLTDSTYAPACRSIAEHKCDADWGVNFVRGIGCNWLVNLAVFQANASDDIIGKLFGIFFPILAFISIKFEHSVANMFYIPLGMMNGADVNGWECIWRNLIPVTLGNIVSGSIIMGVGLWYVYVRGHTDNHAHDLPSAVAAHEGGSPDAPRREVELAVNATKAFP